MSNTDRAVISNRNRIIFLIAGSQLSGVGQTSVRKALELNVRISQQWLDENPEI